jgi:enoyl-CoA hydratase
MSAADPADAPAVITRRQDGILIVTLNRPSARNAVNRDLAIGLADALVQLDNDATLRVAVINGAGRGFCSGMDLNAFTAGEDVWIDGRGFAGIAERAAEKPLIAAIEGFAVAGGLEIALACDILVAARGSKLGLPEVSRALVATGGGLRRLQRRVSWGVAIELALSGELITAERGYEIGLVNRLTEPGHALADAVALAETIASNGPLALVATKKILQQECDWSEAEFWARQEQIAAQAMHSEDAREGATAFVEKRAPVWRGR